MSRVTHVPITPSVLDWAIKESGYEPDQLASAVGVSTADIQQWLSGKSLPNLTQARKLANKLHRSLAALLLPNPPRSQSLAVEFRHSLTDRQELNPNERRYLRRARRFQETLSWLSRELELQQPTIPSASLITAKPSSVASFVRSLLGVSTKDQKAWTSPSSAFHQWRSALERMGIIVFLFPLGKSSCTGFSLWDDRAPIVAVNTAWNESARIFTLFHETAHLVTRTSSACLGFRSSARTDEVERWCESFSAQLLMPADEVLATLREFGWHPGRQVSDLAVARRIATVYKVSLRAATIRLIDLEAANWSLYNQIPPISDDKPKGGGGSGRDRTQIREDQLGERTTSVLIRAVQRDVLERFQAVEMLDIPDSKFDQLAAGSTHIQ